MQRLERRIPKALAVKREQEEIPHWASFRPGESRWSELFLGCLPALLWPWFEPKTSCHDVAMCQIT